MAGQGYGGHELVANVAVPDENGSYVWYGPAYPDTKIPAHAARQMGAHCWKDGAAPSFAGDHGQDDEPEIPNQHSGSTAAWVAYAESLGVATPDGAKRGQVIEAVRAAGHPVE